MILNPESRSETEPSIIKKIAYGADSEVFLLNNGQVLKKYLDWVDRPEQIALYRQITNQAADLLNSNTPIAPLVVGDKRLNCSVNINPVTDYTIGEDKLPELRSVYIPGPRFDQISDGKGLECGWDDLPDIEREFIKQSGLKYSELFTGWERLNFCQFEPVTFIDRLSFNLNQALAVWGIHLVPLNMKLRIQPDIDSANLIVTDLCPSINNLKRR
jgi:hypothetical protein